MIEDLMAAFATVRSLDVLDGKRDRARLLLNAAVPVGSCYRLDAAKLLGDGKTPPKPIFVMHAVGAQHLKAAMSLAWAPPMGDQELADLLELVHQRAAKVAREQEKLRGT